MDKINENLKPPISLWKRMSFELHATFFMLSKLALCTAFSFKRLFRFTILKCTLSIYPCVHFTPREPLQDTGCMTAKNTKMSFGFNDQNDVVQSTELRLLKSAETPPKPSAQNKPQTKPSLTSSMGSFKKRYLLREAAKKNSSLIGRAIKA